MQLHFVHTYYNEGERMFIATEQFIHATFFLSFFHSLLPFYIHITNNFFYDYLCDILMFIYIFLTLSTCCSFFLELFHIFQRNDEEVNTLTVT